MIIYRFATMSSSKIDSSFFLVTFAFVIQTVFGDPLFHFCSSSENFTANDPYEANLNKLMGYLDYQTPSTGFGKGAAGENLYGLALCRGDVSISDCKSCVVDASIEIRKRCPNKKAAIIWYDHCLLKYSDKEFFGQIDSQNKFCLWNFQSVSRPEPFNEKTKALLSQLANKAYVTPKMYAVGEMLQFESKKLYGLTQCTRDLSMNDCKKCLDGIIAELPRCCGGKEGGRVVTGSCNIRYELYPIVTE
ncbi:Cysteine-rich repeat secretory protein [Melia azedarach]|uniref:Cysteine-rich repeat secretory protein n=1 Tax=Melia azedarach TaxID=155640 RepID=A0ACC1Z1X2_MELAZ|nr:Cysteine-rich repeat secretory protein [Melia azedarach]